MNNLKIYTYDCEVFSHDWLTIFKLFRQEEWIIIHNDPQTLRQFIADNGDTAFIGFNSKNYDQFIIKSILLGFDMEQVKQTNDFLIEGGQGWDYPPLRDSGYIKFNNVDIMNDMQLGQSLKSIEGHLGLSVEETSVPFDIQRPLTQEEVAQTIHYCKHDVETTEKVVELRQDYLKTKINIGKMAGLEPIKAMSMTNAKLTSALLHASPKKHDDEREYTVPSNLKLQYVPQQVLDFFDRIHDKSIPDEKFFKSKMTFYIGECEVTIGLGGIHGGLRSYCWEEDTDGSSHH